MILASDNPSRPRECRYHQAIPRRQHLVVEMRTRPFRSCSEERLPGPVECLRDAVGIGARTLGNLVDRHRNVKQVFPDKLTLRILWRVSVWLSAEPEPKPVRIGAEQLTDFFITPQI